MNIEFVPLLNLVQQYISGRYSAALTEEDKQNQLRSYIEKYLRDTEYTVEKLSMAQLTDKLYSEMAEYSVLTPFLGKDNIEEINVNAWNDIAVTYTNGKIVKLKEHFFSPAHAVDIVKRLLHHSGMIIDNASPMSQGHLPNNTRITALKAPIVDEEAGISVSIRLLHPSKVNKEQIVKSGNATQKMIDFLCMCMRYGVSTVVAGATSSGIFKHDIDDCIKLAMTEKDFYYRMKRRGYVFDFSGKYPTVSHPSFTRSRRLKTLGDEYTPERISKRIEAAWRNEEVDIPKQEYPAYEMWGRDKPRDYRTMYVQFVTVVSVVKSRPDSNRNLYKLLGDEIRKLDRLIEQQNLLCSNDIDTGEQLTAYKGKCKSEIYELTEARKKLRSMLKTVERKGDTKEVTELKDDISNLSARLKKLRRDILVCDRIEEQQPKIEEKIDKVKESNMKEMNKDEQFRRRR